MSDTLQKQQYERAETLIRVHGILSMIFGGIGLLFMLAIGAIIVAAGSQNNVFGDVVGITALFIIGIVLYVIPHIYLIIAGTQLIKQPAPKLATTLIIINLIVGFVSNIVILVFAIINLAQMRQYELGYKHTR